MLNLKLVSQAADIKTELSPETFNMLSRSCFDCHSGKDPNLDWTFKLRRQVTKASEKLDFSKWDSLSDSKKSRILAKAVKNIQEEKMPTKEYLAEVKNAKVTPLELKALQKDVDKF